jgi:NAD-dependent deacetylase
LNVKAEGTHFDYIEAVMDGDYYSQGISITLKTTKENAKQNMERVVLKSDTCTISIPELAMEVPPGKGKYSTITDLLVEMQDNLQSVFSNSHQKEVQRALAKLDAILKGQSEFTLKLEDPLGNSVIQCIPQGDYGTVQGLELYKFDNAITCKTYRRTRSEAQEYDLPEDETTVIEQITGEEGINKLVELIKSAKRIVGLTGAGISVESGIPAFRNSAGDEDDPNLIWNKFDPRELVFSRIMNEEDIRAKYWDMHILLQSVIDKVQPNASHRLFKYLYDQGKLHKLITQNIDGLHQRAGVPSDMICEIHGTTHRILCYKCNREYQPSEVHQRYLDKQFKDSKVPYCDECGPSGILKHATISFGENLDPNVMQSSFKAGSECDLMIVMGTALAVAPINQLPLEPVKNGVPLVILNLGETPLDCESNILINGKSGETCERILAMLNA